MCGIAGFVGKGTEDDLWRMVKAIRYRGPDYQGISLNNNAGLAHSRLSILDLSADANQPFFTPDKNVGIVFNGEIYNFQNLKDKLLQTGKYQFSTTSDTEVLLYEYLEQGEKMLDSLNGMFAFALYDFRKNELLLARDRMGKKPLYYTVVNDTIIYASELKSILLHPSFTSKELNPNVLNQYLTFDYVPTPESIFKNIYKLEPSQYLIFKDGKIKTKQNYYRINFSRSEISFNEAVEKFDSLMSEAVKCRLMSDVPLGVFLSGGIDSSTVAYYAQKNSTAKIKTFSIGFQEKSYDESNYAKLVAAHLGTQHHEQILTAKHSLELLPEIIKNLDEPFADPSIIPTYFLSKFTRQHVTVALGGDGSDELLAGYPTFLSDKFKNIFHLLPKFVIQFLNGISDFLPPSDENISLDFKIKQFLKGFESEKKYTHTLWLGSWTPKQKNKLLTKSILSQISNSNGMNPIDKCISDIANSDSFNQLLFTYYRTYLLDDILVKVDRASMYNSLEVRAPFLDVNVVNFLNSLPKAFKIKGFNNKLILKKLMRNKIPNEIIDRPKKGFGIPVSLWLKKDLKNLCEELLSENKIKQQNIFNYGYIAQLKNEHYNSRKNHRKLLWNLMIFQMWSERFLL